MAKESQKEKYWKYYELANHAKDAFDAERYTVAAQKFENAFKEVKRPLWNDLEKCFISYMKSGNSAKADSILYKRASLFGMAISKKYFEDDSVFNQLKNRVSDIIANKALEFNSKEKLVIDSLFELGQSIRKNGKVTYPNGVNIDSTNAVCLLSLIREHGFPKVTDVGIKSFYHMKILIIHSDFSNSSSLFNPILYSAVEEGHFLPMDYAEIVDRRMNFSGQPPYYYQIPYGFDSLSKHQKREINKRRRQIGLRDVEKSIKYSKGKGVLRVEYLDY